MLWCFFELVGVHWGVPGGLAAVLVPPSCMIQDICIAVMGPRRPRRNGRFCGLLPKGLSSLVEGNEAFSYKIR